MFINTGSPVVFQEGSVRGAGVLLDAGIDVNTQDSAGHTPLALAVKHKKRKVCILAHSVTNTRNRTPEHTSMG